MSGLTVNTSKTWYDQTMSLHCTELHSSHALVNCCAVSFEIACNCFDEAAVLKMTNDFNNACIGIEISQSVPLKDAFHGQASLKYCSNSGCEMTILQCVTVSPQLFSIIVFVLGTSGFVPSKIRSNLISKDSFFGHDIKFNLLSSYCAPGSRVFTPKGGVVLRTVHPSILTIWVGHTPTDQFV